MNVRCVNRTRSRVPARAICRDLSRASVALRRRRGARALPAEVHVVFIGPPESRRLARRYLGTDRAANVLSFHYGDSGEILLTPAIVRREARGAGVPAAQWLRRVAIHGLMHLSGYHHEGSGAAARRFERREASLLARLRLASSLPTR